jgi:hypothetical protein
LIFVSMPLAQASSSSSRPNTPQLGKTAVRHADGKCCFDSVTRAFEDDGSIDFSGLQDIHLFPRSYKEEVCPSSFTAA